ncbi:MAG: hypothetical protein FJ211_09935 [Ignavibacteria bacterium]|nr:hypothetical protein [Ignavibacteria bacterium]
MNIKTLEAFVKQENRWMAARGAQPYSLLSAKDRQEIAEIIDARLSPENLSCDGELSRAETNRRYRNLARCAEELLSIDPSVVFYEYN